MLRSFSDDTGARSHSLFRPIHRRAIYLEHHGGNVSTRSFGWAGVGWRGLGDGDGTNALFSAPYGMAADSMGNVYVADQGNQVIRKMTPPPPGSSVWQASTLAGEPGNQRLSGFRVGNGAVV